MAESAVRDWYSWRPSLYKFRSLGPKATAILERPHLFFAPIKVMSDRTEVGADISIAEDKDAIRGHLEEYLAVLRESREFEHQLYMKQMLKREEDMLAPFRASRRFFRLREFDGKIEHANGLIGRLSGMSGKEAKELLTQFYESLRRGLREAAVCCLTKTPESPKMWDEYADGHRGVCFQFEDRIFKRDKTIQRVDVSYTTDGRLHPLDIGYLNSYRTLYSTKHLSYQHENEVRFFLFGEPRPVSLRAADLTTVILGSQSLKPFPEEKLETERRKSVTDLCKAFDRLNAGRNWQHRTTLQVADWSGFGLRVRGESTATLLQRHA